jgi:hypothetical protein
MAINPNVDFVAGAVLTASQQNRFGRGVMTLGPLTSNTSATTVEATRTNVTFTAVANRYYKITWFEGNLAGGANASLNTMRLRTTSTTGTIIGESLLFLNAGYQSPAVCSVISTFAAGSQTIYARVLTNAATATVYTASGTQPAYLTVEDIGPA